MQTYTTKFLLANVFRNFGITDGNWTRDALDWIGEAIQGIGYHVGFEKRLWCVEINNHIGCYPCELQSVIGVSYKGCKLPLGADVSGYGIVDWKKPTDKMTSNTSMEITKLVKVYEDLVEAYNAAPVTPITIREEIQLEIDRILNQLQGLIQSERPSNRIIMDAADYYNVDLGQIKTSFSEGTVHILGTAIKLDKEGFPVIIDEFNYKKACEFYIVWMLLQSGHTTTAYNIRDAFEMWELYRRRASNKAKMPSIDAMDRFMKLWTRYRFEQSFSDNFFINAETRGTID